MSYPVATWDFRRPDKVTKEQLRTIQVLHEGFARSLEMRLSGTVHSMVSVKLASVVQLTYAEFIASLPSPTVLAAFGMQPLKTLALLELGGAFVHPALDRLFGGPGRLDSIERELSDAEFAVMEGVIGRMLEGLGEAWAPVLELKPRLVQVETHPQFAQIVPPQEMVVLATFDTKLCDIDGRLNLCYPFLTIEPILQRLSAQYLYAPDSPGPRKAIASVASLPMEASVSFATEDLALDVLLGLRKGAMIEVPQYGEGLASLWAGGEPVLDLVARPGARGKKGRAGLPVSWALSGKAAKDLAGFGAGADGRAKPGDSAVEASILSLSAELSGAVAKIQASLSELTKKQEELQDQLIFQSPDRELPAEAAADGHGRPFASLKDFSSRQLAAFLQSEGLQLIALVVSRLEPTQASAVFCGLPEELQPEVARRIASMEETFPDVMRIVEEVLRKKLSMVSSPVFAETSGMDSLVGILELVDRETEIRVIRKLETLDAETAESVKRNMFVFEDISLLDKASASLVLSSTPEEDILLSLKGVQDEVSAFVWSCLPASEVPRLKETFGAMGAVRLRDVEAAQRRIVETIRVLEEEGRIVIGGARVDGTD
jgi:flagellar motor switch protein FliM